jgi:prepilin-type processing-associated H-X9-DG protein
MVSPSRKFEAQSPRRCAPIEPDGDTTARLRKQTGGFLFAGANAMFWDGSAALTPAFRVAEIPIGNRVLTMISVWLEA